MSDYEIKKYPNGYAVLVSSDNYGLTSVAEFDEFLANSVGWTKRQFPNRLSHDFFKSGNPLGYYLEALLTGEFEKDVGKKIKRAWEKTKQALKGTHTFDDADDEEDAVYWETSAQTIYQEQWKAVIESQLSWLKDCESKDFIKFSSTLFCNLSLDRLDFVAPLVLQEDPDDSDEDIFDCEQYRNLWVNHLTTKLSQFEEKISSEELDEVIEYFTEAEQSIINWSNASMIPDPDYWGRYVCTIESYIHKHPNIQPVRLSTGGYQTTVDAVSTSGDLESIHGFLVVDKAQLAYAAKENTDAFNNVISYFDQVLSNDFYQAELIFIVPKGKEHLYPEAEYFSDLGCKVVRDLENYGRCLGLDALFETLEHVAEWKPLKETHDYRALGQVTKG